MPVGNPAPPRPVSPACVTASISTLCRPVPCWGTGPYVSRCACSGAGPSAVCQPGVSLLATPSWLARCDAPPAAVRTVVPLCPAIVTPAGGSQADRAGRHGAADRQDKIRLPAPCLARHVGQQAASRELDDRPREARRGARTADPDAAAGQAHAL